MKTDEQILVIDDNRQMADFLSSRLLPSLGYKAVAAYSGNEAIAIVRQGSVSLVLTDLQLNDTTGLELLRKLAEEGYRLPTILITGHGSEQVAIDAFRLGVQDYLIKPVDPDELSEAISRALVESRLRRETDRMAAQLREQVNWLTVLSKVGQSVTSTLELDEVLRRIMEAGVQLTRAEEGFLALLDEESGQLFLRAVKNIEHEKSKTMRLPIVDNLVGTVIQKKRPLRISQVPEGSPLKVCTGFLVHSLLYVPLISRGKTLGVLSVDNRNNIRPFKEVDEALLMSLADYAAIAIENANNYLRSNQEIAERKRVEIALRESEKRYALAVRGANDGIWDWDLDLNTIYYSPRWKAILGFADDEITESPYEWFGRIHPDDIERVKLDISAHIKGVNTHFECEHRMRHKDGSYRWILCRGLAVRDGGDAAVRMAGSLTDITDRRYAEEKLLHDAFHDALTGLPNRALFIDRLKFAVERAKRRENFNFAVIFLDLDRFKDVNDSLGHMVGDQLLVQIAKTLNNGLRSIDTVARLGGDEFVILIEDIADVTEAVTVAERIKEDLSRPVFLQNKEVFVTTSIGIVYSATGYQRSEDVLRDADIAMYRAKALGKARYEIFDPSMRELIVERLALEADFRQALEHQELQLYYQPILSISRGKVVGFEALARWPHPSRGLLYPSDFIPLAEDTGMIIQLGQWVLQEACRQLREWQKEFPSNPPLSVSVNISGKQVPHPEFMKCIRQIIEQVGLEPSSLKLEITESAIMENVTMATNVFKELNALGIQVEIDDFGVGYSSLSYLSNFPISALKIDRSFVQMILQDDINTKIVQAIVMLAHGLGISVIAEGVETKEQLERIMVLGCEHAQGFLFSTPVPPDKIRKLLLAAFVKET